MPQASRRPPRGHSGPRLIEAIAILHGLAGARPGSGSAERRRRQQLSIAQRLLDPLPRNLHSPDSGSEQFWRILRWGGLGLLVARLLAP
jgi:hypothetical protein